MELLFDRLGPEQRDTRLAEAVSQLAETGESERGAVYTRPEIVNTILQLVGYTPDRPLHHLRLLEPSSGNGDFLLPAIDGLLQAYKAAGGLAESAASELEPAIRAVELNRASFKRTEAAVLRLLTDFGLEAEEATRLTEKWLICDDFLLTYFLDDFDVVVGNPPYVRQERIPEALLSEYRRRYRTVYDRADLYVPFLERGLDLLQPGGMLGFICANRWTKNKYGGPLREKVAGNFQLSFYIDMENLDAFHSDVIAYPAITVIRRPSPGENARATRIARAGDLEPGNLPTLASEMASKTPLVNPRIAEILGVASGSRPWLLANFEVLPVIRRLEASFPTLETVGCKVGIGVATGVDRVFIQPYDQLPVEESRKLELVMAGDLKNGCIEWRGFGVINPFNADGSLVRLDDYPRFRSYIEAHRSDILRRHVAKKNPAGWYRTIDRIYPELRSTPKLLIPDIKGTATVVFDEGRYYPHHNLYHVSAANWDLRALQTVLRSSIAVMFVAAYCTRMSGGFLRFQAQYLRRIRVPRWKDIPLKLRDHLTSLAEEPDTKRLDAAVFELYELSDKEGQLVATTAAQAQIVPKREQAIA